MIFSSQGICKGILCRFLIVFTVFTFSLHAEDAELEKNATSQKDDKSETGVKESKDEKAKDAKDEEPLKLGNLSLLTSQQPGPLVGFGGNVIDKGQVQLFLFADEYRRKRGYFIDVIPSVLYGITDSLSIFFNVPIAPRYKEKQNHSSGFADIFAQLEYVFYTASDRCSTDQATIVINATFPSGSFNKNPKTGYGSPLFFFGATYNHTGIYWFYFGSLGAALTTFHSDNKAADLYLYEIGFGRNIASPPGWIFAWMVEVDGQYASRDFVKGKIDLNSGGNIVYITPSLWISSKRLIIQLGAGGVLTQHLFGDQSKFTHQIIGNFGYTF
jgi:hypothetical protein